MSQEAEQKLEHAADHEHKDQLTGIQIIKNAKEFVLPFARNYTGFEYYQNKLKEEYEVFQQKLSQLIQVAIFENYNPLNKEHRELRLLAKEWKNFDAWLDKSSLNPKDIKNLQNIAIELITLTNIFVQKQIADSEGSPTLDEKTFADSLNISEPNLDLSYDEISLAQTTIEDALGMEIEQLVALYNELIGTDLSFEEIFMEMLEQFDENLDFKNNIETQARKYFNDLL